MYRSLLVTTAALSPVWQSVKAQSQTSGDMGPAAFMWPEDREWGAAHDNVGPCGSLAGVGNRTEFPMSNGAISLVLQDDAYNVTVSISYDNDPTEEGQFEEIITPTQAPDVDPGHQCFAVPNPVSGTQNGANATLQLKYVSDFFTERNETFYACTDITYVENFTGRIPCFNVTADDPTNIDTELDQPFASATGSPSASPVPINGGGGLSGGAIAGIVVGAIVGGAIILAALFFLFKRYHSNVKRNAAVNYRMNELTNPAKRADESGSERL